MAETNKAPEKPATPRVVPDLHGDRMRPAEFVRTVWHVDVPFGTEPDDLLVASYWAHQSHRLRQNDVIECLWEDGSGFAHLRVLGCGHGWAKVALVQKGKFESFVPEQLNRILPGHVVKYVNNFAKWSVIREADKRVLKDKCDTEGEACTWLANYAKSLAA